MAESEDYPNLDFMRACAVLSVCVFHLLLNFRTDIPGPLNFHELGHWGVLVFFVHTSLVLTLSLDRQRNRSPSHRLLGPFLIRRAFRILPLSVLVVVVVEVFSLPVGHLVHGKFSAVRLNVSGLLSNLFLVQNLTHTESATAPLWSLPYEMQMYFLLPVLFLLARSATTVLPVFCLWFGGLLIALHAQGLNARGLPDLVVYLPYFLPGVIAYKLMANTRAWLPSFLWPVALAGISAYYLAGPSVPRGSICCLLLGASIPHFAQLSQPTIVQVSRVVARYSYGIYLTHFILIWLAFDELKSLPAPEEWAVFILSMALLPFVLYQTIEGPMIALGRKLASGLKPGSILQAPARSPDSTGAGR